MNTPLANRNQRILIIDDNRAIHGDFRKILGASDAEEAELEAAEAEIFGAPRPAAFEIDTASQGEEGLRMVAQSLAEGRPYAMAFVDVRMPPGWDGIETTRRIWQICPDLQIVICTAYSDCSWSEMHAQLQPHDRLLILKKPFDTIEVLQLSNALTEKWRLLQESRTKLDDLERMVGERTRELEGSQAAALQMMDDAVRNKEKVEQAYQELKREAADRRKLEEQFRDQASQLLRSQRMESVGRLASGIAHDMNNVLSPILLSAFMLRQKLPDFEFENTLATIETSTRRGAELVKQLLTFARGSGGGQQPVRPAALVGEMEKLILGTFPKNISLCFRAPDDIWTIKGDATQLHQILLNLCVNARDAMPQGGTLTLGIRNFLCDQVDSSLPTEAQPGPYVCFQVSDTGEGIPPEVSDKIFEPFFTTKEFGSGTGLGLSTVIGILRGHHGYLKLSSRVGEGTTFEIFIPAASRMEPAPEELPSSAPSRGRGQMILIVDDEERIREIIQKTLRHHGYQVLAAGDGREAIAQYSQHRNEIKAVLTDLMMPVMDGVALIRTLREMDPGLPVIASSGMGNLNGKSGKAGELRSLGVSAFLSKPYGAEEILATVGGLFPE